MANDLAKLTAAIERLPDTLMQTVGPIVGETTIDLIQQGFDDEKNPYGEPWAPLKAREGRILRDRGLLYRNWHWAVTGGGVEVSSGQEYASFHQDGTKKMVARKMVPDPGQELPRHWAEELDAALEEGIAQAIAAEIANT